MFDGRMWARTESLNVTLDNLIADGVIPPMYALLLETDNIKARWEELGEDSGIEDVVADELLPWARARWPVTKDPERLIIAGQGIGALAALLTAVRRPECFGNAILQSASLWRGDIMERMAGRSGLLHDLSARVWLEVGAQEQMLVPYHHRLARLLTRPGCTRRYVEYNGGHDYACWRGGIADGLAWVAQGWVREGEPLSGTGRRGQHPR
jgi:enterochelin esterase family protein